MSEELPREPDEAPGGRLLRTRLSVGQCLALLIVLFFIGPLFVSNYWGYMQSRQYLTEAAFRNIRNVASLEASETLEFVRTAEKLVPAIVAGNQHLFLLLRMLRDENDGIVRSSLEKELQDHIASKAREGASVSEFHVISAQGVLLASSDLRQPIDIDMTTNECFQSGKTRTGVVGFIYGQGDDHGDGHHHDGGHDGNEGGHKNQPHMLVASPIHDSSGEFLGVFCAEFDFDVHEKLVQAHRERTRFAVIYLIDRRGRIVCGSFGDDTRAPYGEMFQSERRPEINLEKPWEGRYGESANSEVMLAYAPIPELSMGIAVEAPVNFALAELERLKWKALSGVGVLTVILLLATYLSWRMLVRPLRALSSAAERMTDSASGETVHREGPKELLELASAFNRMSLGLRDSHNLKEEVIEERTKALRDSQEFLELLLDSIEQRVIVVNANCRIIKTNQAATRMCGRDIVGESCCQAFEGSEGPLPSCPVRRTFETGESIAEERSQRTVRGQEPVRVETYPIFDADGKIESVVEIGRVVTAEKQLQMRVVHQEKMAAFGQLAAGVAHEIGNPLSAIDAQLQVAQRDPDAVPEAFDVVRKQVARMDRMLRQLVEFTRQRPDEFVLASANAVVEDVSRLLEHDPRARRVVIDRKMTEDLPCIRAKEDHVVQILLNLGLNALDAIPEGGTVEFSTSLEDGQVVIRVRDTGSGIPEKAGEHIFEPFFTTKGNGRGTGLGLFVSKRIAEEMGGRLEFEETGRQGTTFALSMKAEYGEENGGGV